MEFQTFINHFISWVGVIGIIFAGIAVCGTIIRFKQENKQLEFEKSSELDIETIKGSWSNPIGNPEMDIHAYYQSMMNPTPFIVSPPSGTFSGLDDYFETLGSASVLGQEYVEAVRPGTTVVKLQCPFCGAPVTTLGYTRCGHCGQSLFIERNRK